MEERIKRLYSGDQLLIIAFIVFLWFVLIYTVAVIINLATGPGVRALILGVGFAAGIYATAALLAVLAHLKNQKIEIYTEDIMCSFSSENKS